MHSIEPIMAILRLGLWHAFPIVLAFAPAMAFGSTPPGPAAALPIGADGLFRERMLSWNAPAPERPVLPLLRTHAPLSIDASLLSSRFGAREDPFRGTLAHHAGIDMPGAIGTPVFASAEGIVTLAGPAGSYGNLVEIRHDVGVVTRYAHLSRVSVRRNSPVMRGELIGLMGSTGRSTGSHLHFELRLDGRAVDPLGYLRGDNGFVSQHQLIVSPHVSAFARAVAGGDSRSTWKP
jgi:murein DD-endopeptidase MepM/ murein hydrolase activator NlpD